MECGRPRTAAASLVVNILPTVIGTGCVDRRATIPVSPFLSTLAIGLRFISGTGLAEAGALDCTPGALTGAPRQEHSAEGQRLVGSNFGWTYVNSKMEILLAITRCRVNQPVRAPHNLVGPDLQAASQLDRFLPACPITSRYNVIPASYETLLHADSSHETFVDQAPPRMWSLLTKQGLRTMKSFDENPRNSLKWT